MILAGDVGGTKTIVGLFERADGGPVRVRSATYASRDHEGLAPILRDFAGGPVEAACFGVAGPVLGNAVETPNLPWVLSGERLARELGIPSVRLLNDLEAAAEGLPALGPDETVALQEGEPRPEGNRALVAAGTGLGMCVIPGPEHGGPPIPTEGGHASFPARTDDEIDLLRFLRGRFGGHVSRERVVSGPGLRNVYDFLVEVRGVEPEPEIAERIGAEDPAAAIGRAGMEGTCGVCARALDLFVAAWGAAAGDLALGALATGGVWVGGGIAPKLLPKLEDGTFREAFRDKGRFTGLLARVPVRVVLNPEVALLGAARRAARMEEENG